MILSKFAIVVKGSDTEPIVRKCSVKKILLETLQNSQENICSRVSFFLGLQPYQKRYSGTGVSCSENLNYIE